MKNSRLLLIFTIAVQVASAVDARALASHPGVKAVLGVLDA